MSQPRTYNIYHTIDPTIQSKPLKGARAWYYSREKHYVLVARVVAPTLRGVWEIMSSEEWTTDPAVTFVPMDMDALELDTVGFSPKKTYEVYPYRRMFVGDVIEEIIEGVTDGGGEAHIVLDRGFGWIQGILFNPLYKIPNQSNT
jgi:hypothetical protein